MNIQGFQKLTLLDYPSKVACTVFTGGCNLRCPFCHNASLVCNPNEYQSAEEDVLDYLSKRQGVLDGVCITGGEPLLQPDLIEFIKKVKAMGYLVKLDTNGSLPEKLKAVIDSRLVDYIAMDIKSSRAGYSKAIGLSADIGLFEKSVRLIKDSEIPHEFRTTAVNEIHSESDFEDIGHWLAGSEKYYIQHFVDSGNVLNDGCSPFSADQMQNFLAITKQFIPTAELRG